MSKRVSAKAIFKSVLRFMRVNFSPKYARGHSDDKEGNTNCCVKQRWADKMQELEPKLPFHTKRCSQVPSGNEIPGLVDSEISMNAN